MVGNNHLELMKIRGNLKRPSLDMSVEDVPLDS